jgi:hypothetical protein
MTTQEKTIKLNVSPEQINESDLPIDFMGADKGDPSSGFKDKKLTIDCNYGKESQNIIYEISFDGESELLAIVKDMPQGVDLETAEDILREFFIGVDEDEDEDEVEEEE